VIRADPRLVITYRRDPRQSASRECLSASSAPIRVSSALPR